MRGILVWRPWRLLVTLLVAWALPQAAMADLNGEMNTMFGSMATATPPSLFATARRGVIAGGSLAVRNPIVNTNLVSITPPGFKAGCGGIDFFGGSFSFINAAQFQALLKAIAANAAGYAFELAMNYMCPGCMSTIETLARKIQDWISKFSNSCLMAQGLVNDTVAAATNTTNNKASVLGMLDGVKQDAFDAWTNLTQTGAQAPSFSYGVSASCLLYRAVVYSRSGGLQIKPKRALLVQIPCGVLPEIPPSRAGAADR